MLSNVPFARLDQAILIFTTAQRRRMVNAQIIKYPINPPAYHATSAKRSPSNVMSVPILLLLNVDDPLIVEISADPMTCEVRVVLVHCPGVHQRA